MNWKTFLKDGGTSRGGSTCFWSANTEDERISHIIYYAPKNKILARKEVLFWNKFLRSILKGQKWSAKINTRSVSYTYYPQKYSRPKNVLYLSLFRYIDYFPEIVKAVYAFKDESEEKVFEEFQRAHYPYMEKGKLNKKRYQGGTSFYSSYLCSYGLIYYGDYSYGVGSSKTPITIKRFQKNLANLNIESIHNHIS